MSIVYDSLALFLECSIGNHPNTVSEAVDYAL